MKIVVYWFRRDLRIEDNTALWYALNSGLPVLPVFIFDRNIISELPINDARIGFIYSQLHQIDKIFKSFGSSLMVIKSTPEEAFLSLFSQFEIEALHLNRDYEPYAVGRDESIKTMAEQRGIAFQTYKDQVVFEKDEILKSNNEPYTVYTPYKNQWLRKYSTEKIDIKPIRSFLRNLIQYEHSFPDLGQLGFETSKILVSEYNLDCLSDYANGREIPSIAGTSDLGPHLRFGTVSIRQIINQLSKNDGMFLSELIWREFFMQILAHFPRVVHENFKIQYNRIKWRNNNEEFERWCAGETGYPLVDAGMRQLNATGYMHNRVRMVTASFLCKHLLIDWKWGEAYYAQKLLDFELSSNNGNWQWAAGTGCDAAPYFRVFNPIIQQQKFDPDFIYIKKWVSDFNSASYPKPMVEHAFARERAIAAYKSALVH